MLLKENSANILTNLGSTATLSSDKYRTTSQIIKDTENNLYFVIAGGCGSVGYSDEIEVFKIDPTGELLKIPQVIKLPAKKDHMCSTIITDGVVEYLVLAGGFSADNNISVYSIDSAGQLHRIDQDLINLSQAVFGAVAGMINDGQNRYLIVAGGITNSNDGSSNVNVYNISSGGILTLATSEDLLLSIGRGDLASGIIEDEIGHQYFIAAGGRSMNSANSAVNNIDVFGFVNGRLQRIDNQPELSSARFDIASGVINKKFFIGAGGYTGNGNCSDVIDMFSIGTDGILKQEERATLKVNTASAVSGVITDTDGKQYFIIAGGSTSNSVTDAVEMFELNI